MRHVILLGGDEAAAGGVVEALRPAGVRVARLNEPDPAAAGAHAEAVRGQETTLVAILFDVASGSDLAGLQGAAARAAAVWPGVPLVACQRDSASGHHAPQRFDDSTLKRAGFHAVAEEPAQLPALLREMEERWVADEAAARAVAEAAPASLLLPEKLHTQRLRAAFELVASLHFATDQKGAASAALAGLAALVPADRWTIYLVGETGRGGAAEALFEPLAVRGLAPSERVLPEGDWRRALVSAAIQLTGAQSRATRAAADTGETVRKKEGDRRVIAVPLVGGDRVSAVLEAVREGDAAKPFSATEASLLSALSLPLSAALSNSARVAEAERLSQTDDLTKLHNARYLRQYLVGELKRARRYGSTVTAVFLDLDDFKQINDRHGHLVGSHVLMEMASVVLASVRDTDVVTRYGGDEFVIILPETSMDQGLLVADRVRERIGAHAFTGGRSLRLRLTASFGVASFPEHAQSPQQLISIADTAMYEAKAARKNCIRFAGTP
ncbi:MAG TPA: GGDEF domain-containing protein [Pyrinomonadaceae bacterium]|jgi:diguanylate cyclase (GGDEF)-like protein|nr:GGDEF domain-containing protein [Pyrinomonadaceae bacterium]